MKNLPKYVAEDRLKQEFSRKGEITDVKLMRTKYCFFPSVIKSLFQSSWTLV